MKVQYVIKNSENIFSPETEAAVDEYVGRLTMEREGEKRVRSITIPKSAWIATVLFAVVISAFAGLWMYVASNGSVSLNDEQESHATAHRVLHVIAIEGVDLNDSGELSAMLTKQVFDRNYGEA
ncbi:MAG: hypothetical protein IPM83_08025 [Ignavibacteria bacterium]|nr:hypothetical protein [Ignavibacteria bacterium]